MKGFSGEHLVLLPFTYILQVLVSSSSMILALAISKPGGVTKMSSSLWIKIKKNQFLLHEK